MLDKPCNRPFTVNVQKAHPHRRARANITVQENKSGPVSGSWAKLCWPRARTPWSSAVICCACAFLDMFFV